MRTPLTVIDREFRSRGTSLESWCHQNGLTPSTLATHLVGFKRNQSTTVFNRLAEALGVSLTTLRAMFRDDEVASCQSSF